MGRVRHWLGEQPPLAGGGRWGEFELTLAVRAAASVAPSHRGHRQSITWLHVRSTRCPAKPTKWTLRSRTPCPSPRISSLAACRQPSLRRLSRPSSASSCCCKCRPFPSRSPPTSSTRVSGPKLATPSPPRARTITISACSRRENSHFSGFKPSDSSLLKPKLA